VRSLQAWLYGALRALRHANGAPLVRLFGAHAAQDFSRQSCIFQLLVLTPEGEAVSAEEVEVAAGAAGLGLRTGCMCNPSQCIHDLGILPEEVRVG
jgi:molybdenum cofactor sulfurtransferase